jgi:hypothetical protein
MSNYQNYTKIDAKITKYETLILKNSKYNNSKYNNTNLINSIKNKIDLTY